MDNFQKMNIIISCCLSLFIINIKPAICADSLDSGLFVQNPIGQFEGLWLTGIILILSVTISIWWGLKKRHR